MNEKLPDFIIIGAMKCATSTLHEQLSFQDGIGMSDPKEPYFFSDDPVYAKGLDWYSSIWSHTKDGNILGESTTHYTKLPTYPHTIDRLKKHVPNAKFIYVMRHPIDRLVSQYIHHWTENEIAVPIDEAIDTHPHLISYSQYAMQLQPFFETFGQERVLPVFFDRLRTHSQQALEEVCQFIGFKQKPEWKEDDQPRNVSAERMRESKLRDIIVNAPVISTVRKRLIPQSVRDRIKSQWQMSDRPELSESRINMLTDIFNEDLALLGNRLGTDLTCANFKTATQDTQLGWVSEAFL